MQTAETRKVGDPPSPFDAYWTAVFAESKAHKLRAYPGFLGGEVLIGEPENMPEARSWLVSAGNGTPALQGELHPTERVVIALAYILETRFGWSYTPED